MAFHEIKTYPTRLDMIADLPMGSVGAEIGVHRGEFACQMLELPSVQFLHLIDPWENFDRSEWTSDLNGQNQQVNFEATMRQVSNAGKHYRIWRGTSRDVALGTISANNTLDWVYIDANHRYEFVLEDLNNWSKIAPVLMGHDFCKSELAKRHNWGVVEAVQEFLKRNLDWSLDAITLDDPPSFKLVKT